MYVWMDGWMYICLLGIDETSLKHVRTELESKLMADATTRVATHDDINRTGEGGATLLHIAAANGYVDLVDYLILIGANVSRG